MSRDLGALLDIYLACGDIESFIQGLDWHGFYNDRLVRAATLHQLMIIGEATKRLSIEFRRQHPAIPWQKMAGMRDHLVHAYDNIELELVWQTASIEVPLLLQALEPLIPSTDSKLD